MIKNILFDCGGVFVEMRFYETMERLSGSKEMADYFINTIWAPESPWLRYDIGEISSAEIMDHMKAYMPSEHHGPLEEFVNNWPDALPVMAGMEEVVDALKAKGLGCYLLSNFADRFDEVLARTPALQKLDDYVISYRIHMLKPAVETFLHTAKLLNIKVDETLFVDDVEANVQGAIAAGMKGYVFTTPASFVEYLKEQGILDA